MWPTWDKWANLMYHTHHYSAMCTICYSAETFSPVPCSSVSSCLYFHYVHVIPAGTEPTTLTFDQLSHTWPRCVISLPHMMEQVEQVGAFIRTLLSSPSSPLLPSPLLSYPSSPLPPLLSPPLIPPHLSSSVLLSYPLLSSSLSGSDRRRVNQPTFTDEHITQPASCAIHKQHNNLQNKVHNNLQNELHNNPTNFFILKSIFTTI